MELTSPALAGQIVYHWATWEALKVLTKRQIWLVYTFSTEASPGWWVSQGRLKVSLYLGREYTWLIHNGQELLGSGEEGARLQSNPSHMGSMLWFWYPQVLQPEKRRRSGSEDDRSGPRGQVIGVIEDGRQPIPNTGTLTDGDGPFSGKTQESKVLKYPPFHFPLPTRREQVMQAGGNELSFGKTVGQLKVKTWIYFMGKTCARDARMLASIMWEGGNLRDTPGKARVVESWAEAAIWSFHLKCAISLLHREGNGNL